MSDIVKAGNPYSLTGDDLEAYSELVEAGSTPEEAIQKLGIAPESTASGPGLAIRESAAKPVAQSTGLSSTDDAGRESTHTDNAPRTAGLADGRAIVAGAHEAYRSGVEEGVALEWQEQLATNQEFFRGIQASISKPFQA